MSNMYYTKQWILRKFFKWMGKSPATMPMVQYWKKTVSQPAWITKDKDGATIMNIEDETETFPGYPRGHSLYGSLSPLKHQIKNQIFNDSFYALDKDEDYDNKGKPPEEVIANIKKTIRHGLTEFWEEVRYDALPPEQFVPPVAELWRVLTKLEPESDAIRPLKEMLCFIMQEDDAYRFRAMDMFQYFDPNRWYNILYRFIFRESYINSIKRHFDFALSIMEQCEIVGDMKERQRLLRRILMLVLEDRRILELFSKFCQEVNFKKLYLKKADKYYFRGKYYKVDYRLFEY